ncbi:hypothetical protein LCGC14_1622110, partial [marine sediment metagenome]
IILDGNITQDAGTTLFMGGLLDATGAVDMDYGSADITDHTFVSDGGTVIIDGAFIGALTGEASGNLVNNAADEMLLADATTNVVTDILDLSHTGGTVTAGFGTGIRFDLEDAGGIEEQASIDVSLDVVTDAAEEASIIFRHNVAGTMQESMRIDGTLGHVGIGTANPIHTLEVQGHIGIIRAATTTDQHALDIAADAAGFGDFKALEIDYTTGAIGVGDDEAVIFTQIITTSSTGGEVFGYEVLATDDGSATPIALKAGTGVEGLRLEVGTFINPTTGTNNTTSTDVPNMIDGSAGTTTTLFVNDNDYILIGNVAAFQEIEFIVTTPASGAGIVPTFGYSISGAHTFTTFSPVDGTNGFRQSGNISWEPEDVVSHVANSNTSTFDIIITRTQNGLGTTPVLGFAKTAVDIEYGIDAAGNVTMNSYILEGSTDDAFEQTIGTIDLTADRAFTLPDDQIADLDMMLGTGAGTFGYSPMSGGATMTNAGVVTIITNANLTGHVTSTGNAAILGSFTEAQLETAVSDDNPLFDGDIGGSVEGILTNSAGLLAALSDETGTLLAVFSDSPIFTTNITVPNINTTAGDLTLSPNGADVILPDNTALSLGTGVDSRLYYDGTDTFLDLRAVGTGDLMIALAGSFPSPDPGVHIWRGDAGLATAISNAGLVLENSAATYIHFLTPNNNTSGLLWGDPEADITGGFFYDHSTDALNFRLVDNTDRLLYSANTFAFQEATTIDATGDLTVRADLIDPAGAVDMDYGSPDITDHTFTSDGGTVISDGSISTSRGATASGLLIILEDTDAGSNFASFEVPALAANTPYVLPPVLATAGFQLTDAAGDGILSWAAAGSGTGAFSDAGDPVVLNTTIKNVEIGDTGVTLDAKVQIAGDADEVQLIIEGHSTQTDDIFIIQQDDETQVFTVSNAGVVTMATALDVAQGGTAATSLDDILGTTDEIVVANGANTVIGGDVTLTLPDVFKPLYIPVGGLNPAAGDLTGVTSLVDDADNTNDFTLDQIEFSASAENYWSFLMPMPDDWDGTTAPKFQILTYSEGSHASNTVEYTMSTGYVRPGTDSWVAALGTAVNVTQVYDTIDIPES